MYGIKVKIIEFAEASFPGWVRCTFTDIHGRQWFVEEKGPIVSDNFLDENTIYPVDGLIAGQIEKVDFDRDNREIVTINTDDNSCWCKCCFQSNFAYGACYV